MRIGVFGDSFAEKKWERKIWWQLLKNMGHDVTSYGEGGSSIMFSALALEAHASKYDLNIWVVSSPARISFKRDYDDTYIHAIITRGAADLTDYDLTSRERKKLEIAKEWITYLMEMDQEILAGESLAQWMMIKHKNLKLIPGVEDPLSAIKFNLRDLSNWELSHYFSDDGVRKFYDRYIDRRAAHLIDENNRILAELINQNLNPGTIFQTEYSNFMIPTVPFGQIGEPI